MRTCFGILVLGLLLLVSACAATGLTISDAKLLPDNPPGTTSVSLSAKVVTYAGANFFYIEEDGRNMGIRVDWNAHGLTVGMRADVTGIMKTNTNKERYILATSATQTPEPNGNGTITPVGMNNMVLGGGDWHVDGTRGQRGVSETIGLNNIGLLVKTWGTYQQVDATTFTVDDGSGLNVKCTVPSGTFLYSGWQYVSVTGISSIYKPNSITYWPNILVRDIDVVSPVEAASLPGVPSGSVVPLINTSSTYTTTGSICSQGHPAEYSFDWGDGTSLLWSTSTSASHSWSVLGTKTVTVTARCSAHPSISATSASLTINVIDSASPGEMISIPAGSFLMGNNGGEPYSYSNEFPQHSVTLAAYSIGKYEVTRGEYRAFMTATGRAAPYYWDADQDWGTGWFTQTDSYPVVGVTYYDAEAFCTWAGGHLPTEAQWERAARWTGTHANVYPWGDTWDQEKCNNYCDSNPAGGGYGKCQTAPVGSYPGDTSPYGCKDMAGNVLEWCQDWYKSYPGSSNPFDYTNSYRVLRGGGFNLSDYLNRCASRSEYGDPYYCNSTYGFRLVR